MHILFISQYYAPEIGAASDRISGLTMNLSKLGHKVTVITGFPNYPHGKLYPGYKRKLFHVENHNGIKVIRVWLVITSKTGAFARSLNYLSFMLTSITAGILVREVDQIIATSGPMFVGLSGYFVSAIKRVFFVFDVRDIWPERIYAGTDIKRGWTTKVLEKLEAFLYRRASKIIAVTNGLKNNIVSKGIGAQKILLITNGVDTETFIPRPRNQALAEKLGIREENFIVIYAGTLGLLQDIDLFIACAERLKHYKDILFLIVGDGVKRSKFIDKVEEHGLTNMIFVPSVSPEILCDYINLSDIGINANTDHPHNNMAIPVKIFPYMACRKPVLLANAGETVDLVERYGIGLCVPPGYVESFGNVILKFYHDRQLCKQCGENVYMLANDKFSWGTLAKQLNIGITEPEKG